MTTPHDKTDMFSEAIQDPEFRRQFEREWFVEDFLGRIEDRMKETGVTRKALAGLLGCSAANVSQLFRRENNLTADTMVDLAIAVGYRLRPQLDLVETAAEPWIPAQSSAPWTESGGARIITFPLRKTGGGVSAESIYLPEMEAQNDAASESGQLAC